MVAGAATGAVKAARRLALLLAAAACQGQGSEPVKSSSSSSSRSPAADVGDRGGDERGADRGGQGAGQSGPGDAADAGGAVAAGSPGSGSAAADEEPAAPPPSVAQLIAQLGAIPAWEGVVQRGQLLARRNQRGVLYGRVGPATGEGTLVWLVDDTEGDGCLAARVAFPGAAPPAGARVAVTGAWALSEGDGARWVWQAERSTGLPEESGVADRAALGPPSLGPPSAIGHEPVAAARPAEAVPISKAKDGDLVAFQVLAAPRRIGEGWLIGDQLGSPAVAMLALPGDRDSYGGIDFRQPDERWRLRRGVTYVVRIGKVRRKDPAKPATVNARNAPIKVS